MIIGVPFVAGILITMAAILGVGLARIVHALQDIDFELREIRHALRDKPEEPKP